MLFWAILVVVIRARRRPVENLRAHPVYDRFIGG